MSQVGIFVIIFMDLWCKWLIFMKMGQIKLSKPRSVLILVSLSLLTLVSLPWSLYIEPYYFLLISLFYLRPMWRLPQLLFYSLVPYIIVDLFQRSTHLYDLLYLIYIGEHKGWVEVLVAVLFMFMGVGLTQMTVKLLRIDFKVFDIIFRNRIRGRSVFWLNVALFFYLLVILPIMLLGGRDHDFSFRFSNGDAELVINFFIIYLVIFLALLFYLNYKAREFVDEELQKQKDQQLSSMISYATHVESLYKELKSFRHDYTNILTSLNQAFKEEDLSGAKAIYDTVLNRSDQRFYDSKYDIANLSQVLNPAMKSILSAKLMVAASKGVKLNVEIEHPIDQPALDILDTVTILSIFLDNAIEAAESSEKKRLSMAYFQEGSEKVFIISNSVKSDRVDTKAIYQYGKSSKGVNRGIGLANVKDILDNYPNASLMTTSQNYEFCQMLTVKDEDSF